MDRISIKYFRKIITLLLLFILSFTDGISPFYTYLKISTIILFSFVLLKINISKILLSLLPFFTLFVFADPNIIYWSIIIPIIFILSEFRITEINIYSLLKEYQFILMIFLSISLFMLLPELSNYNFNIEEMQQLSEIWRDGIFYYGNLNTLGYALVITNITCILFERSYYNLMIFFLIIIYFFITGMHFKGGYISIILSFVYLFIIRSWKNVFFTIIIILLLYSYIDFDELISLGGMRAIEYTNSTSGMDIERSNESFVVNLISKIGIFITTLFYSVFFIIINIRFKNKEFFPISIFLISTLFVSLFSNEPFVNISIFSIIFWTVFSLTVKKKYKYLR